MKARVVLVLAVGAALLSVLLRPKLRASEGEYEVKELGTRLYLILGKGGNTVVLADPTATLAVNCKFARDADGLKKLIASLGGGPLRWLLLTDHRPDNAEATRAFDDTTIVVAHHRTDERLRQVGLRGADLNFDSTVNLRVGKQLVTAQHKGAAQADGVSFVYFHEAQVLVLGDLLSDHVHPVLLPEQGGSIRSTIQVLKDLRKDYKSSAATLKLVPGAGKDCGHAAFDLQIEYWSDMLDQMNEAHRHGLTLAEAIDSAERLRGKYADWAGERLKRNLEIAYDEAKK